MSLMKENSLFNKLLEKSGKSSCLNAIACYSFHHINTNPHENDQQVRLNELPRLGIANT
jgi:hypothetical protein